MRIRSRRGNVQLAKLILGLNLVAYRWRNVLVSSSVHTYLLLFLVTARYGETRGTPLA